MKKVRLVIAVIAVALMAMGVGYAMWSQTITVNVVGTLGTFEVKTTDAYVINNNGEKVPNNDYTSAEVQNNGKIAQLIANKLIPGGWREYRIVFKNVGDCPAVLKQIDLAGGSKGEILHFIYVSVDDGSWIRINGPNRIDLSKSMDSGESVSITVKIKLDEDADNCATEKPFNLIMTPLFVQR